MRECLYGEYVRYEDYAKLKAEVERLTERNQFLEQVDSYLQSANLYAEEQRSLELEAQVERLTKAGDAMAEEMLKLNHPHASIYLWCRAKDGKGCKAEEGKQP